MPFDFDKLYANPGFAMGLGLLGASSPRMRGLMDVAQMAGTMSSQQQAQKLHERQLAMQEAAQKSLDAYHTGSLEVQRGQLASQDEERKMMGEYRQSQSEQAAQRAKLYEAQIAQTERKLALQEQSQRFLEQIMPSLLKGQMPQLPQMPGAGGSMQPQSGPDMLGPLKDGPRGKFGTPAAILDNLEQVESGGNPYAIGPDIGGGVRARGPYQFLPATQKMLEGEIGPFNPFNRNEARDAADYYIQKMAKENGGDYTKAIAQYGGFKRADATPYVQRVLTGSPESVTRGRAANDNSQATLGSGPIYQPEVSFDENGAKITLKPSYEPQRIDIERQGLQLRRDTEARQRAESMKDYGPGGFKEREANRQDTQTGMQLELQPGRVAQQQATVAKTNTEVQAAQRKSAEDKTQAWHSFALANNNLDMLSKKVQELSNAPGLSGIYGMSGKFPDMPGGPAADARALQTSVVKQLAKETLSSIREASKTGGALGNVSDRDVNLLETAIQNLDKSQSVASARKAMGEVQQYTARIRNIALETYEKTYNESPIQGLPAGTRIGGVDPKTGKTFYRLPNGKFVTEK